MTSHKVLMDKAVEAVGSQQKLGEAIGKTQQGISYMMNVATSVSAEDAIAIERATQRAVTRSQLRPDIFGKEGAA